MPLSSSILDHTAATVYFHLVVPPVDVRHIEQWLLAYFPELVMEVVPFDGR